MRMILAAAFLALATPALAQPRCAPSTVVLQALTERHGEVIVDTSVRAMEDGVPIQWHVWANEGTGSWSLTGTRGAVTCLFRAGRNYSGYTVADFLDGEAA